MTIETITYQIPNYIYDRSNESNNSIGGKRMSEVQERP